MAQHIFHSLHRQPMPDDVPPAPPQHQNIQPSRQHPMPVQMMPVHDQSQAQAQAQAQAHAHAQTYGYLPPPPPHQVHQLTTSPSRYGLPPPSPAVAMSPYFPQHMSQPGHLQMRMSTVPPPPPPPPPQPLQSAFPGDRSQAPFAFITYPRDLPPRTQADLFVDTRTQYAAGHLGQTPSTGTGSVPGSTYHTSPPAPPAPSANSATAAGPVTGFDRLNLGNSAGVPPSPPPHRIVPAVNGFNTAAPMAVRPRFDQIASPLASPSYNPADYALSSIGSLNGRAGYGGAYGPAQSYAIGGYATLEPTAVGPAHGAVAAPVAGGAAPVVMNPPAGSRDGWGYGGLQSLYLPTNPPPLPSVANDPAADRVGLDEWAEKEWEAEEQEWMREQERIAAAHPLPQIPVDEPKDSWDQPSRPLPQTHGSVSTTVTTASTTLTSVSSTYTAYQPTTKPWDGAGENAPPIEHESEVQLQPMYGMDGSFAQAMPEDEPNRTLVGRRRNSFEEGDDLAKGRPLPAVPTDQTPRIEPTVMKTPQTEPMVARPQPQPVPRATSMVWTSAPTTLDGDVNVPARAKTNASEHPTHNNLPARSHTDARPSAISVPGLFGSNAMPTPTPMDGNRLSAGLGMVVDLPSLPLSSRRFVPSKLTTTQLGRCAEPWSYSNLISWLKIVTDGEQDLRQQAVVQGLARLFTFKVPTMNTAEAETLASSIVSNLTRVGVLEKEEEWVRFTAGKITGVVVQLTGGGCYATRAHARGSVGVNVVGVAGDLVLTGRCYSRTCGRTVRKVAVAALGPETAGDHWMSFYRLTPSQVESVPKREIERQNVLHEIVQKEEAYRRQLDVLADLFRTSIRTAQPAMVEPARMSSFIETVFGRLDAVRGSNEESLLPQLRYRQLEQGPWLTGVSDIFREWIRKARPAYVAYAAAYPKAQMTFRREIERNIRFRMFIDNARGDKRCGRLSWQHFLKAPISTLQHYGLLLSTVLKQSPPHAAETAALTIAIEEVRAVTRECDDRVAEMDGLIELDDLRVSLQLRKHMNTSLRLDQHGRRLLHKGVLFRPRANRIGWIEAYAVLFDHCLVLAKPTAGRDGYDVSRLPIPIDLLVLDDPQNIGPAAPPQPTVAPGPDETDKPLFPFRVQHLGHETYSLFAATAAGRDEWCARISAARLAHAAALRAQRAEPFKIRVLADSAFGYESGAAGALPASSAARPLLVPGSPIDQAVRPDGASSSTPRPSPVCRSRVNCSVGFVYNGTPIVLVGTDFGVFASDGTNPNGWVRALAVGKVSQVAVIVPFSLVVALVDKTVVAYPLDTVLMAVSSAGVMAVSKKLLLPQKVSSGRGDVLFFVVGTMKDRIVVFYKKTTGMNSVFTVMEPIAPKTSSAATSVSSSGSGSSGWSSLFRRAQADTFREYDQFYVPMECTNLALFNSTVSVATLRGFEVLTLDKKEPWSVPNLDEPSKLDGVVGSGGPNPTAGPGRLNGATGGSATATLASRLRDQTPLMMFRVSEQEFLVVYSSLALYVDKYGDVSRSAITEFVGKAKTAALFAGYLILFDPNFVEIRSIVDGRLRQVIVGRDVRCLDDGRGLISRPPDSNGAAAVGKGPFGALRPMKPGPDPGRWNDDRMRSVKMAMRHPVDERVQLVVELLLDE